MSHNAHLTTLGSKTQGVNDITYMQDVKSAICKQTQVGDKRFLTDRRENGSKTYLIGKLGDGHCWMLQNLALGGNTALTVSSTYSNIISNYTLPASTNNTTNTSPGYFGNTSNSNEAMYNGTHINGTNVNAVQDTPSTNTGGYYTYEVASAGTAHLKSTQYDNITSDICPSSWKLPAWYNGSSTLSGEFHDLTVVNVVSAVLANNMSYFKDWKYGLVGECFPNGGCPIIVSARNTSYWSSTIVNDNTAYFLNIVQDSNGNDTVKVYSWNRYYGYNIRCVVK